MQKNKQQNDQDFSNLDFKAIEKMQKSLPVMPDAPAKTCIVCKSDIKQIKRDFARTNNRDRICDSCLTSKITEHVFKHKDATSFRFQK